MKARLRVKDLRELVGGLDIFGKGESLLGQGEHSAEEHAHNALLHTPHQYVPAVRQPILPLTFLGFLSWLSTSTVPRKFTVPRRSWCFSFQSSCLKCARVLF